MHSEFLNLSVWDDSEVTNFLGERPILREKLHHWPLSYVERIDLPNRSVVIKYAKLSCENAFYLSASASCLLKPLFAADYGDTSVTVLPFVNGREATETEAAEAIDMIPAISGESYWIDASTHVSFMDIMLECTQILQKYDPAFSASPFLEKCASFEPFFSRDQTGLIHGDLKRDNILISTSGTIILDWQRPMKAPLIIDKVSAGIITDPEAVRLAKSFETYWLMYAFDRCLSSLPHVLNWAEKNIKLIL